MKRKEKWPQHIDETLELMDTVVNPEDLYHTAQPIERYLKQHRDPALKALYGLMLYPYYMTMKKSEYAKSVLAEISESELGEKNPQIKGLYHYNASKWAYIHLQSQEALSHIEEALATFKATGNSRWQVTALLQLYNCCSTFNIAGNYDAIEVLWEAVNICNEIGLTDSLVIHNYSYACAGIASFHMMEEKHAAALEFLQEPYRKLTAINNRL